MNLAVLFALTIVEEVSPTMAGWRDCVGALLPREVVPNENPRPAPAHRV